MSGKVFEACTSLAPCASCGRLGLVLGVSLYECQLLGRIADDGVENRTDKGVRIRIGLFFTPVVRAA